MVVSFVNTANCSGPSPEANTSDSKNSESKEMQITNFTLEDYNGKKHSLNQFTDSKAGVVMFIATRCPYSNAYNERMVELYNDYTPMGVKFVGINSNKTEDAQEVKEHAQEHKFPFAVLKDWDNVVADQFDASYTPEIYVLDSTFSILYHGRIDNSHKLDQVKTTDLQTALDEILAGKEVSTSETKAFGCTIKRVSK
jgi:peroxiredoxin